MNNKASKLSVLGIIILWIILFVIGFIKFSDMENDKNDEYVSREVMIESVVEPSVDSTDVSTDNLSLAASEEEMTEQDTEAEIQPVTTQYHFRNKKLLTQHFEKHGGEFSYGSMEEYEQGADAVIHNPNALHKIESEDGDDVYYIEATNEFVVLSTDGYIRTYFKPDSGIKYYNKQ